MPSKRSSCILFGILCWLLVACQDQQLAPTPREYARVRTLEVEETAFSGELFYLPADGVSEHGFVWSKYPGPYLGGNGFSQSLGPKNETGRFTIQVGGKLEKEVVYYVRAYAKSGKYVSYGSEKQFTF